MNYVLFMPDSLRAESLGCYGHPLVKTPNYDKLAAEGTLFGNCYAQHPICGPSRCSLMTGWYPHNTGCRTNEFFLHPHQPSLFQYLKRAGFNVVWFGKNDLYSDDYFNSTVSFSKIKHLPWEARWRSTVDLFENEKPVGEPGYSNFMMKKSGRTIDGYQGAGAYDLAIIHNAVEFLASSNAKEKPFVLFLPIVCPHPPYSMREPYYSMYDSSEIPPLRPANIPGKTSIVKRLRQYHGWDQEDGSCFRRMNSVYLGMVSFTDALLGMVLDSVEQAELAADTAIFAFSDHGDYAGDYGLGPIPFGNSAMLDAIPVRRS